MNHDSRPLLSCSGIGVSRSAHTVLQDISLEFKPGELVGILGLNGAGKTTLLRILAGLLSPDAGEVRLDGNGVGSLGAKVVAKHIAYLPQRHGQHFPFSVRRMVELGRIPHSGLWNKPNHRDQNIVDHVMQRLDVARLAERPVTQLSGGERQRVWLARALAQEPQALLLDEPMTGLDYGFQIRLVELLRELSQEGHMILLSSHRPEELFAMATRVIILDKTRISADGPAQEVVTAQNMSRLYGVALEQVDEGGRRFFHPASNNE